MAMCASPSAASTSSTVSNCSTTTAATNKQKKTVTFKNVLETSDDKSAVKKFYNPDNCMPLVSIMKKECMARHALNARNNAIIVRPSRLTEILKNNANIDKLNSLKFRTTLPTAANKVKTKKEQITLPTPDNITTTTTTTTTTTALIPQQHQTTSNSGTSTRENYFGLGTLSGVGSVDIASGLSGTRSSNTKETTEQKINAFSLTTSAFSSSFGGLGGISMGNLKGNSFILRQPRLQFDSLSSERSTINNNLTLTTTTTTCATITSNVTSTTTTTTTMPPKSFGMGLNALNSTFSIPPTTNLPTNSLLTLSKYLLIILLINLTLYY